MRIEQEKVQLFLEKHGRRVPIVPTTIDPRLSEHRYKLIREELEEYRRACDEHDLVGIADAIGDLLYVVLGTAASHGIDASAVFNEIHRSNMTKTPLQAVADGGKGGKGEGYEPPRLAAIIFNQVLPQEDLR